MKVKYNREELESLGYTVLDTGISNDKMSKAQDAYQTIYNKAKNSEYKYVRVYDDLLGKINISAIEMPFHPDIIDSRIIDILNETNIIDIAKDYLGNNIKMTLSRYHVTGDKSHIGMWHRDGVVGTRKELLISLFLYDEQGFELIESSHDRELKDEEIGILDDSHGTFIDTVHASVKKAQMIVFNPAILHRGISENPRANIHFRFEVDNDYEIHEKYNQYNFNDKWKSVLSNKNTLIINKELIEFIPNNSLKNLIRKSIKTFVFNILFFLPLNSFIYKKSGVYPNMKLRRLFNLRYQK